MTCTTDRRGSGLRSSARPWLVVPVAQDPREHVRIPTGRASAKQPVAKGE